MRNMAILAMALLAVTSTAARAGGGHGDDDDFQAAMEAHEDERWDEAAAKFIASFKAGHREETSAYNAACALARAGRKDEAFKWLEQAYSMGFDLENYLDDDRDLRSLRSDPRFLPFKQKVFQGRGSRQDREALRVVQRWDALRAHKSPDGDRYDEIGKELMEVRRYDEAAQAFLAAAEREEHPASSIYNAACARSLRGDKAGALELLQRAVEAGFADPQHIDEDEDLDFIRGEARFKQIRALAAELEVPSYPSEWNNGKDQKLLREWRAALPRIEAAARNHPKLGQAWFNLGMAKLALGSPDQAILPFGKAIGFGYRRTSSMYNLACAHAVAGHKDEAFAWLEQAFAAGFDQPSLIRSDPDLDNIRYDVRFRPVLERARAREHEKRD